MKKILVFVMMGMMIAGLAGCEKTAGSDTENVEVSDTENTDSTEVSDTESIEQTTFSSDDWESYEIMVDGKILSFPCSMNQISESTTGNLTSGVIDIQSANESDDGYSHMYTWSIYDSVHDDVNSLYLYGIFGSEKELEEIADEKILDGMFASLDEEEDAPFVVTLPGNIVWGESNIDDAIAVYGEPDKIREASEYQVTTNYKWYNDSGNSSLTLGFYGDSKIISYMHFNCPENMLRMKVRLAGTKEWGDSVVAKAGDEVEFQIEYRNLTGEQVDDVMIRDVLPDSVVYVEDSTYLYNSNHEDGMPVAENTVTTSGINIGSYSYGGNAFVRFTGKVLESTYDEAVNWANVTVDEEVTKDSVTIQLD